MPDLGDVSRLNPWTFYWETTQDVYLIDLPVIRAKWLAFWPDTPTGVKSDNNDDDSDDEDKNYEDDDDSRMYLSSFSTAF